MKTRSGGLSNSDSNRFRNKLFKSYSFFSCSSRTSNDPRSAGTSAPRDVVKRLNYRKEWASVVRKS